MSDPPRWQRRSRMARETDPSPAPAPKPPAPIILGLARPSTSVSQSQHDQDLGAFSQSQTQSDSLLSGNMQPEKGTRAIGGGEKQVFLLKSRDENRNAAATTSASNVPASIDPIIAQHNHPPYPAAHRPASHPSQPQRHPSTSQHNVERGKNRLDPPPQMKRSVQIIDEHLRWIDLGIEDLLDQTDFLVVGAVGLQGAGKSTILSLLAGNSPQDAYRSYVFQPEVKETREDAQHQTLGVDMFATPERIILLDTQPVFSASVMDFQNRHEKKYSQEYSSLETCIEGESIKLISFLLTVCHVVIVAQDWFTDITFLRSLLTAEMLRPQTHIGSHEGPQGSSHQEEPTDFHPTVVFVQNKANQDDFTPETYADMKLTLHNIFCTSKLHYQGAVSMHRDDIISSAKAKEDGYFLDVNLFLLPTMEYYKAESDSILNTIPEYRGFPSFAFALRSLRHQIYSVPRQPMSSSALSERNWFHFAARTWETVKKSSLITEYNRLLP